MFERTFSTKANQTARNVFERASRKTHSGRYAHMTGLGLTETRDEHGLLWYRYAPQVAEMNREIEALDPFQIPSKL